jgi:hypothetical protein
VSYKELEFADTVELTTTSCCVCGTRFAMEAEAFEHRKITGENFYCPNGHSLAFKSRLQALEAKLAEKERALTEARCETASERMRRETAEADLLKHRRRTKNGVCPCCRRSFQNLQRHMKTKHPTYLTNQ